VTENDILSTLEEIYTNEKLTEENKFNSKEKFKAKKSMSNNDCEVIENILTPEIDDIIEENESPCVFKQSAKRKYTVINTEKKIVSGLVIKNNYNAIIQIPIYLCLLKSLNYPL